MQASRMREERRPAAGGLKGRRFESAGKTSRGPSCFYKIEGIHYRLFLLAFLPPS
jgi:hypothetical protein